VISVANILLDIEESTELLGQLGSESWVSVMFCRTRDHMCLHLALLCICDMRALDAMDQDALMAQPGLLFMVIVAFCLYDMCCMDG
jgi:hypothetical protein